MANLCREDRVNDLIHRLKSIHIRVCPRRLRGSELLYDEADEVVVEVLMNMLREVLDAGKNFCPFHDPWEGKAWELYLPELDHM